MWIGSALVIGQGIGGPAAFMLLFSMLHITVGVGLTYSVIAGLLNRTRVSIADGRFRVEHGPAPWPGEADVAVTELEQLYCKEQRRRIKHGYSYTLSAVLRDGRSLDLVRNLESPDIARFLELEMKDHLRISDQLVVGELKD